MAYLLQAFIEFFRFQGWQISCFSFASHFASFWKPLFLGRTGLMRLRRRLMSSGRCSSSQKPCKFKTRRSKLKISKEIWQLKPREEKHAHLEEFWCWFLIFLDVRFVLKIYCRPEKSLTVPMDMPCALFAPTKCPWNFAQFAGMQNSCFWKKFWLLRVF